MANEVPPQAGPLQVLFNVEQLFVRSNRALIEESNLDTPSAVESLNS